MNCKEDSHKFTWDTTRTKSLIIQYEKYPNLYNQQHELYKDKHRRLESLGKIRSSLNILWHGTNITCTIEDIKRKLKKLHNQYLNEQQKISNEAEEGKVYTPIMPWYSMLKFLELTTSNKNEYRFRTRQNKEIIRIADTNSSSSQTSTENFIDVQGFSDKEKAATKKMIREQKDPLFIPSSSQEMRNSSKDAKSMKHWSQDEVSDHLEIFGKFVAIELRGIYLSSDDVFLQQTKRHLQQVLTDAWSQIDKDKSRHPASSAKRLKSYKY